MTTKVFIDGAAGTTGLEIRERLADRSDVTLLHIPDERRKDAAARAEMLNAADAVILCLPDDAAREAVALIANPDTRVIDASTAHRTAPGWTYGFAEIEPERRAELATAKRVSNPGCYPTGFLALVRPLVRAGLLAADAPLSVNATSGYSGGGKSLIAAFEQADASDATDTAFRIYGLDLAHKHVPEMQGHAGLAHPPIFLPAVARTYRGMLVEVPVHPVWLKGSLAQVRDALVEAYRGSPVVRVDTGDHALLTLEQAAGTDRLDLFAFGNDKTGQIRLVAALDNLGKGAGGAAVQNLNLMCGLGETAGLRL
ncbi:N-acetyl-gamma-glutamyl-phosphate reductase [Sphingomonas laterariae]|uniref:N-acetyl-gamma-glutamyl-phosphate reductase n=1 Tax=Edaphosphingomonas laterariae TaxID=861865 RepID=A0A239H7D1_9SPHN|nr:N-acetyl-gamma-glutamyl-phosphate reductase [Sphingomonas laterariae]SNS77260.1 N-acetyl-gamma-glutamyl-phosphate reductase [Sphingomonas laterariae]